MRIPAKVLIACAAVCMLPINVFGQNIIPATFWDFDLHAKCDNTVQPGFGCDGCGPWMYVNSWIQPGIVAQDLADDRKPVHSGAHICPQYEIYCWFHESEANTRYCRDLIFAEENRDVVMYKVLIDSTFYSIDDVPIVQLEISADDG